MFPHDMVDPLSPANDFTVKVDVKDWVLLMETSVLLNKGKLSKTLTLMPSDGILQLWTSDGKVQVMMTVSPGHDVLPPLSTTSVCNAGQAHGPSPPSFSLNNTLRGADKHI